MKAFIVSLGCPKNVVDFESILGDLLELEIVQSISDAGICIVNTCTFIESATQESIDTILEIKRDYPHVTLIVSGCLPQRYGEEIKSLVPEVDLFVSERDPNNMTAEVRSFLGLPAHTGTGRRRLTPQHYAYLKISDGCDNRCSYCTIPDIKGGYRSVKEVEILRTAHQLAEHGVLELILVAQDTTYYGRDTGAGNGFIKLLENINVISGLEWIRILYTHPAHWNDELIDAVARLDKVVKYIDMPVQHISDPVLQRMGRRVTRKQIEQLICKMRSRIPGLALRTSLIVGFPGEGEKEFNELKNFVREQEFDRLGVFQYSSENGTPAAGFTDQVPAEEKNERRHLIMETQAEISALKNRGLVGRELWVLVDQYEKETDTTIGRTQWDAPEIDNAVILPKTAPVGRFYRAEIKSAGVYDLYAN